VVVSVDEVVDGGARRIVRLDAGDVAVGVVEFGGGRDEVGV